MARYSYGGRPTVESCKAIDVRELRRGDLLRPGLSSSWNWSRNGEPTGSVGFKMVHDAVILTYHIPLRGSAEGKHIWQWIPVTWTACSLGGHRPWFRCLCGRRVAVLYGYRELFECRLCCGLAYESQSESPTFRSLRRAQAIRERLGGNLDVFSCFPAKPPGMQRRKYNGLRARGLAADQRTIDLFAEFLQRF